jgi:ATP-dependent RNA helicase DBP3
MFSATWPTAVRRLASDFLISPIRITVGSDELTASTSVEQSVIVLDDGRQKETNLLTCLKKNGFPPGNRSKAAGNRDKVLVFALYKKEAARLEGFLHNHGYEVGCIQGDLSQDKRTKALDDFKTGKTGVLVATGTFSA